jgi:hypothetical protein
MQPLYVTPDQASALKKAIIEASVLDGSEADTFFHHNRQSWVWWGFHEGTLEIYPEGEGRFAVEYADIPRRIWTVLKGFMPGLPTAP